MSARLSSRPPAIRRLAAAGGVLVLAAGLAVAQASAASAADSTTPLGIALATTGLGVYEAGGDIAVAGGKIFVSGRDRIVVTNPEGTVTGAITGLSAPVGLAAAADGDHVYAALSGSNQVAEIDTDSLAVTRRLDVAYPCPMNVSLSGTRLFVGYGCDGSGSGVFSLDLSAEAPASVQIRANGLGKAPLVAAASNTLVTAERNMTPATVYVYDLNGTSATLRGTVDGRTHYLAGPIDLTITSDGSTLVAGFGRWDDGDDQFESWDTTSLTRVRAYDAPGYPDAVAISPDGVHVAGASDTRAALYDAATAEKVYSNANSAGLIIPGSLAFSGTDVVGVVRQGTGSLHLWRMQGALLPVSSLTLTASGPATALEPLALTGRLTLPDGVRADAQPVVVTRRLPDGTSTTVGDTTTADGTFTITDTPPRGGDITYTAVWDGTPEIRWSSASTTVTVAKRQTSMTLTGPKKGVLGKTLNFRGALDGGGKLPPAGTRLTVERTDGGSPVRLKSAILADDGSFSFTDTLVGGSQFTYTVKWAGDDIFLSSQASHVVPVN
ncbi:hypothetical protein [Nonomuraea sp. NPDC005650]|uniref:hypothetical protein n=1 Tax=Nonomuraea sp. NPDC005650 TaxID=3157045 RepID=UPI0033B2C5F8